MISNYEQMTMTESFYEERKATLYFNLCNTNSLIKERKIREEIDSLEKAYKEQMKEEGKQCLETTKNMKAKNG